MKAKFGLAGFLAAAVAVAPAMVADRAVAQSSGLFGGGTNFSSAAGRNQVSNFLRAGNARPREVANRAVAAIQTIRSSGAITDPGELIAAADAISQEAQAGLCSPRVVRTVVSDNFQLPPGAIGFDFGPQDAPVANGFSAVHPGDSRLNGGQPRGLAAPDNSAIAADGLVGVGGFDTELPNGQYRVTLLTRDLGEENLAITPLGSEIDVNGQKVSLGAHPSDQWLPTAVLGGGNDEDDAAAGADTRTGAITVDIDVQNGRFELGLNSLSGQETFITAAILEPVSAAPSLVPSGTAGDFAIGSEECLELEEDIETAVAELVEEVAPAAGEDLEALDLPEPVLDEEAGASPA